MEWNQIIAHKTVRSDASPQSVNNACDFEHVLRDDGLSHMAQAEQITFLLFRKMA